MGLKRKNVQIKLNSKAPIGFKMVMPSLGENILEGKEENCFF